MRSVAKRPSTAAWLLLGATGLVAVSFASSLRAQQLISRYGGPDLCNVRMPLPPGAERFAVVAVVIGALALAVLVAAVVQRGLSPLAWRLVPLGTVVVGMIGAFSLLTAILTLHDVGTETLTVRPPDCSL
jgi:drug/metabolite transporter (DMT)-like permease